ncbi:helix-turn-helix transcriptional regulator [Streptococcus equinus]|uniref:helix-turn-helix transcriptional regulator n=1 Tax=Streptococcus equinus TaxID=1335 RepID=UPI003530F370
MESVIRTEDNLTLKNRLKELRARDGLNQTQLAKLAKVSRQTISLLERNEYTPSVIIALRIARIFNESVENVFSLDEEGEDL